MKTKAQKQEEVKHAEELLSGSKFLAFAEFSGIPAEEVRKLRRSAKDLGANILMIKKRLLSLLFKQKGIDYDLKQFKTSVGTVFSTDVEKGSGAIYKFLSQLGETKEEKAENIKKILGGYDLAKMDAMDASKVIAIGQLPPREVLLSQLMGMLVAPLRAFMYILQEKAKMGVAKVEPKSEQPASAKSTAGEAETPSISVQETMADNAETLAGQANPNPETGEAGEKVVS